MRGTRYHLNSGTSRNCSAVVKNLLGGLNGHNISNHPLVQHKTAILRCVDTEPKKFRQLVRELAALLTYEATADLLTAPIDVQTPLAIAHGQELMEKIGLVPILRAGPGNGRRGVGVDAVFGSLAHRRLPGRKDTQTRAVLQ